MNTILTHKDDLNAFRTAVRNWLAQACPSAQTIRKMEEAAGVDFAAYEAYQRAWMAKLSEVGLATPHWPLEYGGSGLSMKHLVIISDEMARAGAPRVGMYLVSRNHVPATLLAWGTEEQKQRYLPGAARGDVWCQGFSEPGAGSDLAALRASAKRAGDEYVINGQKTWSSFAMYARYCILLARTSSGSKKQEGISYFIMDMKAPGVEVRPIRQSTGRAEFCELFLTDVRIPASDLLGEEGRGWQVAQTTLASERGLLVFEQAERLRYRMERFHARALAGRHGWLQDVGLRREFMRLTTQLQAARGLIRELLAAADGGRPVAPIAPSVVKVAFSRVKQRIFDFEARATGLPAVFDEPSAQPQEDTAVHDYIDSFSSTIAGGSNEIQLNIISERGLGMPRS